MISPPRNTPVFSIQASFSPLLLFRLFYHVFLNFPFSLLFLPFSFTHFPFFSSPFSYFHPQMPTADIPPPGGAFQYIHPWFRTDIYLLEAEGQEEKSGPCWEESRGCAATDPVAGPLLGLSFRTTQISRWIPIMFRQQRSFFLFDKVYLL